MKLNRWSWGYVPVILVLGVIWYEFWQTGAFAPPPPRAAPPAEAQAAAPPAQPPGPQVNPTPEAPVATPEPAKIGPVIDDAFFNNPPPISISVSGVPLSGVVEALRTSFKMPSYLMTESDLGRGGVRVGMDRSYTLKATNVPFWDVVKSLQDQGPIGFYPGTNSGGLVLSNQYSPVYRFQSSGPAILYPISIVYSRSISGQAEGVPERPPAMYQLNFGAAVDPRILVARAGPVEVMEAIDDTGRTVAVQNNTGFGGMSNSNSWNVSVAIPALEPRAHKINLKCQLHFSAQLPSGTATLEDASQKVGEAMTLGDRKFHMERFETQGAMILFQITADDGVQSAINGTISDSNGRSMSFAGSTIGTRTIPAANLTAPYRLTLRDPTAVRDLAFAFDIKDVPLP